MLDLNRLNVFIQVAATQNCSEAAKRLHLSQPTVSKHIQTLEAELGIQLFERDGARLHITNAGMTLLPWARKLIHQASELEEMMSSMQETIVGQLYIACSTTSGKYILPQLAARFCSRFPNVKVKIMSCTAEDITLELMEEKAQIGVVSREINDAGLETQPFFNDMITLIVPNNHPWAFRNIIEPSELLEEPIILREETSGTRRVVFSELAKFDIHPENLNIFMEIGNAEAIVRTVAEGYGIAFVSNLATSCPLERGNVKNINVKGLNLRRTIYMVRKINSNPNRVRDAFWSFIHAPENEDLLQLPELD